MAGIEAQIRGEVDWPGADRKSNPHCCADQFAKATGKPTASGQGSQVIITFDFPERASSGRFGLPPKGAEDVSVWVLPTIGDHAGMQALNAGDLSVSRIDARRSGASRFEGSFSGTISDCAGKVKRAIANGRFTVDGAVFFDPAASKGARN